MNKKLVGLFGLTVVLASCGSAGVAPDGSASLRVSQLKTEYRTSAGQYVACDNVSNGSGPLSQRTAVAAYFAVAGNVQSVDIGLRGNTTNANDNNYNTTASGNELQRIGGSDFKVTFYADSSTGMLPQSIVVNPAPVTVKTVVPNNYVGSFHAQVTVNTGSTSYTRTSQSLGDAGNIAVYSGCNVIATTGEEL